MRFYSHVLILMLLPNIFQAFDSIPCVGVRVLCCFDVKAVSLCLIIHLKYIQAFFFVSETHEYIREVLPAPHKMDVFVMLLSKK